MGALNGYGNVVSGFRTLGDAEAHTRWRVMSGLLELSSAAEADPASGRFAVDVAGVTVAWGPKRGDGALRLQFTRVPLDGGHSLVDSNRAARLYDVKTPGTWLGASDGPRVTADGSQVAFMFQQHSDDNLKVDSSHSTWRHVTLLQGNIGSAIEIGTYGLGLRANAVVNTSVARPAKTLASLCAARTLLATGEHRTTLSPRYAYWGAADSHATAGGKGPGIRFENDAHPHPRPQAGVYVHRITQSDVQEDSLGSFLGSRTCPFGIRFADLTIRDVYIPQLGHRANSVGRHVPLEQNAAPSAQRARLTRPHCAPRG